MQGWASQSIQFAPMDTGYLWRNDTTAENPGLRVWNSSISTQSESGMVLRSSIC